MGIPIRWIFKDGKYRLINNKGEFVNDLLFDHVGKWSEGFLCVEKDRKIGFLNSKGEMAIPFVFETDYSGKIDFRFQEGLAHVLKNGKYGFINKKGKTIIPFEYDLVFPVNNGEVVAWKDKKWLVLKVSDFSE